MTLFTPVRRFVLWCLAGFVALAAPAMAATFTTFDIPGALSISVTAITASGDVLASYKDAANHWHGAIRQQNGTITTFDPVGSTATSPWNINSAGEIVGYYVDSVGYHGFIRSPAGAITAFDVPGASNTYARSSNASGLLTGYYVDGSGQIHGFTRQPEGTFTTFDAVDPFGGTPNTYGIFINTAGDIAGFVASSQSTPFIRTANGAITTFQPTAVTTTANSIPTGLNDSQTITGVDSHFLGDAGTVYGPPWIRTANGRITKFNVPGSIYDHGYLKGGTYPQALNGTGQIAGYFYTSSYRYSGFLRDTSGTLTTFDVPGALNTFGTAINDNGAISGTYSVSGTDIHVFIRFP